MLCQETKDFTCPVVDHAALCGLLHGLGLEETVVCLPVAILAGRLERVAEEALAITAIRLVVSCRGPI